MTPKGFLSAGRLMESDLVAKDEVVRIYGLHTAGGVVHAERLSHLEEPDQVEAVPAGLRCGLHKALAPRPARRR